jgi:hypothetical protein
LNPTGRTGIALTKKGRRIAPPALFFCPNCRD